MPLSITLHRTRTRRSPSSSSQRKQRRRTRLCLPCVAIEREESDSLSGESREGKKRSGETPLRREGFEHVDAARCGCSVHPTSPPSTPSLSPQQSRESRERSRSSTRRRRHEDLIRRGTRGRSVQLHDLNSNMMVLVTIGEGENANGSASGSGSGSSSSSGLGSNSVGSSEDGGNDLGSDSESSARSSSVTDEGSLSRKLEEGDAREIVLFVMKELRQIFVDDHTKGRLMEALEENLGRAEGVHPDERTKGHWTLAKWYGAEKEELVLRHCRSGLFLLHMREKLFPEMAAEMNMMAAKSLLRIREGGFVKEVIRHVERARTAMFAYKERDASLELKLCEIEAEAWAVWEDECEGLKKANMAYEKAAEMWKMGGVDVGGDWVDMGLLHLQVMLRGLKHKKRCGLERCGGEGVVEVGKVIERAEGLRRRIVRYREGCTSQREDVSLVQEFVAKAYLQRGEPADLHKAKMAMDKALAECSWTRGGGRYAMLREMAEDIAEKIDGLEEEVEQVQPSESEASEEGDLLW